MAKYSDIKGFTVQTLSSDPAASVASTGSWASGGSLNNGLVGNAGFGTYTAAVSAGGTKSPGITNVVEHYDGSSWTNATAIPAATDSIGSCGTQTAGLVFGGQRPPNTNATFEYDGSSWTAGGNLNTTRRDLIGAGTQTAGLAACGAIDPPFSAEAEQYNGSAWTTVAEANTAARSRAGGGTSTSAMAYGGFTPPYTSNAETWNGSAWTEVSNISSIRGIMGGGGSSNTDQITFGGYGGPPGSQYYANTEFWNGSSWTELNDLSGARSTKHSLPSSPTANQLYAGGHTPPNTYYTTTTEEWSTTPSALFQKQVEGQLYFNSTTNTFKETITDIPGATWASGGNLNTARQEGGSAGIQTAALCTGGGNPTAVAVTEQYNGSAWTEVNDLNSGRKTSWNGFGLSYSAAIFSSGSQPPGTTRVTNNESWDGTNWTEVNNVNTARNVAASSGSSTSGIGSGGYPAPSYTGATEIWDGTNWTETTDLNTPRYSCRGAGQSSSLALNIAGYSSTVLAVVEQWNGSSWTEVGDLNTARYDLGTTMASPVDSVLVFGGDAVGSGNTQTEFWNGTSWTELNDLSTARWGIFGAGTGGASALAYGGYAPPASRNVTEEWTADLANKTITTS